MTDEPRPLRAVFLDIGDTVMRPNPSWEAVYAIAFREFGVEVEIGELYAALRKAYHHGGWGIDDVGFEPSEESSFQRTVAIDAAAIAELGLEPMPEAFYRRLAELFMVTSHWHIFPDAYPTLSALQERGPDGGSGEQLGLEPARAAPRARPRPALRLHRRQLPHRLREAATRASSNGRWSRHGPMPGAVIHVGDHLVADIEGARGVGIDGVLIDRFGRHDPAQVPDGVPVITALDELLPIVDARLNGR